MDEMEKKLLEKLIRKRDLLVRSIQRVCTNIENMVVEDNQEQSVDVEAAKIDKEDLDKKMAEFHEAQSQIEMEVEDDKLAAHENERTRVETIARSAKIVLADFIAASTESALQVSSRHSVSSEFRFEKKLKRPEIQIPKFEGDFKKWNDFKNVFESLVVNEQAYSNVEKMVYLKQAAQGSAADVIKKFDITERNFDKAWEKLKKRYENRRATINTHLQSLTQLPTAKSEAGIQKLLDAATDSIESLDALGIKNPWPYMVSFLVTEKLDNETRKAWELETVKEPEYPKFERLEAFLQQRVRVIESMGGAATKSTATAQPAQKKNESAKNYQIRKSTGNASTGDMKCFDCQGPHTIAECSTFAAKPMQEKIETIKKRGLCFQCLCKGHMVLACKAARCSKCGKRHHILLHVEMAEKPTEIVEGEVKKNMCTMTNENSVFLPSALVEVSQGNNKKLIARTFLDSCSEINLVTENLVKRLKCCQRESKVVIETLAPGSLSVSKCCKIVIESRYCDFRIEANCHIVPCIANKCTVFDNDKYRNSKLKFADDPKIGGGSVELLLGAEFFERVLLNGRKKVAGEPYLRETVFGWVAIGATDSTIIRQRACCYLTIQDQLQQFFVLEEVTVVEKRWTTEEKECDEHYEKTHVRDATGFEVELPKELTVEFLGESRHIAFRQFCALERRLNEEEKVVYCSFMHEYIDLAHMTLVPNPDPNVPRNYLPHHAVYKKSSTTSKMRSVFNASSPTSSGYSLNDVLMKGPVLQEDLFSIMVRFRTKKFAFTADIEKMYRQVRVKEEDRKLQCILWRDKPSEPIRTYELNTVTYGTKPASYLATKCLFKLSEECESKWPETAVILKEDFYMDDVLTGGSSIKEVKSRLQELRQVLSSANFPLQKFASNSAEVLEGLDRELVEGALEFEAGEQTIGVLGLRWLTSEDRFAFYAKLPEQPSIWTKREILSEVSRIFDPLGLLSPVTISFKIMLQSLWVSQTGWDDVITGEVVLNYMKLREKLTSLPSIHIPRFVGEVSESEFHIFCDASEKAFGAAVYLRHHNGSKFVVRLLCAKTRVAPVKKVSLPRLELCGSVLAAKLFKKVRTALKLKENSTVVAWSDSTIVLSWLAKPEHPWCSFVSNRVTKVVEVIPSALWRHVRSQDNAADCISRGIEMDKIEELYRFLEGPEFLQDSMSIEYVMPEFDDRALLEEKKKSKVLLSTTTTICVGIFDRISNFNRAIRIFAYTIRYVNNCSLEEQSRTFGNLELSEVRRATLYAIRLFQKEIDERKLSKLDHFLDEDGVLRLRSRISNAELSDRVKYPIILPKCRFLVMMIEFLHIKYFHANCTFLRSFINLEYFVLSSLNRLIRSVVYKCTTCRRFIPNIEFKIPVGQLPPVRVKASPAFVEVGVDFAGPLLVRAMSPSGNRGKVFYKSYIAVFVCMVTRACHLEVVEDLSTKCFLDAFSRFVARRGLCANVYSDNGTNFVGADRELRAAFELVNSSRDEIQQFAVSKGFSWHFIPQRAPNFGGLWEAAVKSFKNHFRKVVGAQALSFVELCTLSTQVECILNSRPICASDALSDCFVTPGHLCIGRSLVLPPELPGVVVTGSQFTRYRLIRDMLNRFWSIWQRDYLAFLRKSVIGLVKHRPPVIGELVLVKDESFSPGSWPIARIIKLYPGKDDVVRVVDIKIGAKIFRRPLIKLVPLLPEDVSPQGGENVS